MRRSFFMDMLSGGSARRRLQDIFQYQPVEGDLLHKVGGAEDDVVELGVIEDARLEQHGRGHVQLVADLRKIGKKVRIGELLFALVGELSDDAALFDDLCPDAEHANIIRKFFKKSKYNLT